MKRTLLTLCLAAALAGPAAGDALVLKSGRKLIGKVVEKKPDGLEITVEGQAIVFAADDVARWIKSPKELIGGSDKLVEEAKALYLEAVAMSDARAADEKFREALKRVILARESYAEARDVFPEGHPELDTQLINIMKLMRLVRERIGSELAAAPPPVKAKAEAPPGSAGNPPPAVPPPSEPLPPLELGDALAVMIDPARRAQEAERAMARRAFREAWEARGPLADVAAACWVFLSRTDREWQAGPKSEAFQALQAFLQGMGKEKFSTLPAKEVTEGITIVSRRVKELRSKEPGPAVRALELFVAALASNLVARAGGKPAPELELALKDMGCQKSEFGNLWGDRPSLAMDDFKKWTLSGEYALAVVQFQSQYREIPNPEVKYALGLLLLFKAVADNRNYSRAADHFQKLSAAASTPVARDHLLAMAKSIRNAAPCPACGGGRHVNCSACKGRKIASFQCNNCAGAGRVQRINGVVVCAPCNGLGTFRNVQCLKCKGAGTTECKARGCVQAAAAPGFESFAEAYLCAGCAGKGTLLRHVAWACPDCAGIGLLLAPRADPRKMLR